MSFSLGALAWAGLLCVPLARGADLDLAGRFATDVRPILSRSCVTCHGVEKREGGLDLSGFADGKLASARRGVWKRVRARVEAGDMPPDDAEPGLPDADRKSLLDWVGQALAAGADRSRRDPGPSILRRLTRTEYIHTLRDLFGLPEELLDRLDLPEDLPGDHFENLGAALSLAPSTLERYFQAADRVVEIVFGREWYAGGARNRLMPIRPAGDRPEREAARESLRRFVRRADRRPAAPEDLDRLMGFYDRAKARGAGFEDAMRATLKPVLVSPTFLFRVEEDRPARGSSPAVPVDDHELAVRLSYFLWGSMPDEALDRLADRGKLTAEDRVLESEVRRMLADEKARSLTQVFAAQWVQLDRLRVARPSQEFFPSFHGGLKQAMAAEVSAFFDHLRTQDRPVTDLLDCDYVFVNEELARHYGIKGVEGDKPRKVAVGPAQHRGGLVGMGAVLAMTSHTFRTSPTLRGKYVLEVILGTPPSPPPANAGILKDDAPSQAAKEATSFREKMAQHARQAACAGCHRKIDPIGFAMENYDAVGAWREAPRERPLDVSGVLPSGEAIQGVEGLKAVLKGRREEFVENFAARMLEYALGRKVSDEDEPTIREVREAAATSGYRFSTVVLEVVRSVPFRCRRPADGAETREAVR